MEIEWDPDKDAANLKKHGLSLEQFVDLDMAKVVISTDSRRDYGETRYLAAAPLKGRLHIACFCMRGEVYRVISLRKANPDERREYEEARHATDDPS
jgi:uncharacterized DUF497 family protein